MMQHTGSPFEHVAQTLELNDILDYTEGHEDIPLPFMVQNPDNDPFQIVNDHILQRTTPMPTAPNAFDPANPNAKPRVRSASLY
jgi:hypothetical protein